MFSQKRLRTRTLDIETEGIFGLVSPGKRKSKQNKGQEKDILKDSSIFGELINKAGYVLKQGDQANILKCDQAIFLKDLKKSLRFHPSYRSDQIIEAFISGLESHLKDPVKFKWALLYTQTSPECEDARGGQQDSLIRLLLNVDILQLTLISLLTEKILAIALTEEACNNQVDIPRLTLTNLRWLDHIVDPESLTNKITTLLQQSPLELQKEVINVIPNIIDDQNHPKIAKELCDLYHSTPELTCALLDCLPYLTLEADALEDIHHSVLKTLQTVGPQNLPVVVKFLLHNTTVTLAPQVLCDIREKIQLPGDWECSKGKRSQASAQKVKDENSDLEVLLFSHIKMAMFTHKYLCTSWLKVINDVVEAKEFRSFDFLVLILIYEVQSGRRRNVESILRNKIRTGLPCDPLLGTTFANHSHVLKEYFESIRKLAAILLRSPEPAFSDCGAALYRQCFIHLEGYHRQDVILCLLSHLGESESVRIASLTLLLQLSREETDKMVKYITFLKGSLDLMDLLTLREAKKLMDSIIHLVHSDQANSGFRDEFNIFVRKQLSHSDVKYQRLGVLGAVLTLKNSVGEDVSEEASDDSLRSRLKEAEALFRMVKSSTSNSASSSALFMDELASNILRNGLNAKLEEWISGKITSDFQDAFIVDCSDPVVSKESRLPFSDQFCLDLDDDADKIVLNLLPLLAEEYSDGGKNCTRNSLITLNPHLRLMRMVESHLNDGNLSNINALLDCGVLFPTPPVYEKFSSLSEREKTLALSCLFYLINWFRELVNAFVTQKEVDLKKKVFSRFAEIIKLQNLLALLLPCHPEYTPPSAVFDLDMAGPPTRVGAVAGSSLQKGKNKIAMKKRGKKRKKGEDEPDTSAAAAPSQETQVPTQNPDGEKDAKSVKEICDLKKYKAYFREFHLDVFNLLFRNLDLDADSERKNDSGLMSLAELEFLLEDLNLKLNRVFEGTKRVCVLGKSAAEKDVGFSHLDLFTAAEVASQAYRYVKPICVHMEKIDIFFKSLIEANDGVEDAPSIFTDKTECIMRVFGLLLTTLKIFLKWPGLQLANHLATLNLVLKRIRKKPDRSGAGSQQFSKEEALLTSFNYLSAFSDSVVSISTAVILTQVLEALICISDDAEEMKGKIVLIIEKFLKKEWFCHGGNRDKGATFNQNVYFLLKALLKNTERVMPCVHSIASLGLLGLCDAIGKDPTSEIFPTLSKSTLLMYYRCLLENLVNGTKKGLVSHTEDCSLTTKLETWDVAIKTFHVLMEILKTFDSPLMFALALKYSRGFLELFVRHGMPLMDKSFSNNQQEVLALIKNLQLSTRFLQHLCTHSKLKGDTRLMQYVPSMKRSLETVVFRVKAMLALNQCSGAFWLGDLKNKDLQGKEITNESEVQSDQDEDEQEAEPVDEDDDQSDVILDEEEDEKKEVADSEFSVTF